MPLKLEIKKAPGESESLAMSQLANYAYRFFWVIDFLAIVVIIAVAYVFLLSPMYSKIMSNQEIVNKVDEYSQKLVYYNELKTIEKIYNGIDQNDKDKINQIVNNSNDKTELYREMQYITEKQGIKLSSVEPLMLDKNFELPNLAGNQKGGRLLPNVKVVKTTLELANVSYESLVNVIKQMEYNLRIMDVQKIVFNPRQRTAHVEVLTYQQ